MNLISSNKVLLPLKVPNDQKINDLIEEIINLLN